MHTCFACDVDLASHEGAVVPPIALKVAEKQGFFNTGTGQIWREKKLDLDRRCRLCADCFYHIYPHLPYNNPNVVDPDDDEVAIRLLSGLRRVREDNIPASTEGQNDSILTLSTPPGQSRLAGTAFLLGLFSLIILLPAPFALLLGILALCDLRRHPEKTGFIRVCLAIFLGTLCTLILICVIVSVLLVDTWNAPLGAG